MKTIFKSMIVLGVIFLFSTVQSQTLKIPAASPEQKIVQEFGLSSVEITYARPSARGRVIFGDLVPYGKMWRTGANSATRFKFGDDVTIEGKVLKAGEYSLYTIPNKDSWEIIFNTGINNWGTSGYDRTKDAIRVSVPVVNNPVFVETFTILPDAVHASSLQIHLLWANTLVTLNVKTDIDNKIMANINDVMNFDKKPYFQAANYYYENDKDQAKALEWIDKALEQNPTAFWVAHLKAKIQVKSGDKDGARKSALHSIDLAKKANNEDYVALNNKLIEAL